MPRPPADAPLLSPDLILSRALTQITEQGVDSLSLRALAESLGVKPNALYHYFPSKEKLIEAAYAHALGELTLPQGDSADWQPQLVALTEAFRHWCAHYPALVPYLLRRKDPLHAEGGLVEAVATQLRRAGVPLEELSAVTRQLIAFVAGTLVVEWGSDAQTAQAQKDFFQANVAQYPLMAQVPAAPHDPDVTFALMIRLLIGGIEGLRQEKP